LAVWKFWWLGFVIIFIVTGSQGGQVGYLPEFHPGGLGLTSAWGNQQKN